jgi:transposase InsO family protein
LTPFQREVLCRRVVEEGWTVAEAADAAACSQRSAYRWLARWRAGESLMDRSSAPHTVANRTDAKTAELIEQLRRLRMTAREIAMQLAMATSTVCAVLARAGLSRLSKLEPPEPPNRYCRRHPGELIHTDIKRLVRFDRPGSRVTGRQGGYRSSRGAGHEYVHVAIDDTSRLAYVEVLENQQGLTCARFLERAVAFFAEHAITVQRVMTDNGRGYISQAHAAVCARLQIKHLRTRPYRPRTNGKAERFIQSLLRECAYGQVFTSSQQRRLALDRWIIHYNYQRPHSSLGDRPPITRLGTTT